MSIIHKKYKYNNSFNSKDSILSFPSGQNITPKSFSYKNSSSVSHSPRDLLPLKPLKDTAYDHYFGQLELSKSPRNATYRDSPISGGHLATEISISDLYKNSFQGSPLSFPSISIKKPKVPALKLAQLPPLEIEQNTLPSSSRQETSKNMPSTRHFQTKVTKKPKLDAYLEYLTVRNSSNEDSLTLKLRASAELRNPKSFNRPDCPALEINSQLIASILPLSNSRGLESNQINLIKERSDSLKKRPSKMTSETPNSLVMDSKLSSKAEVATQSKKPQITNTIRRVSLLLNPKQQRKHSQQLNEHMILFKDIATNLHEVYLHHKNEKQFSKIVEVLAEDNFEILKLVHAKYHKINDYDPVKLEQKFCNIEVMTENLSVPLKLQKKREGKILVEAPFINELQIFNHKLEDYNVKRRYENLEAIHYGLKETQRKIKIFQERKGNQLAKEGKIMDFLANLERTKNLEKNFNVAQRGMDPSEYVENLQRNHQNYKNLKKKNLDFALCINGIYNEWVK